MQLLLYEFLQYQFSRSGSLRGEPKRCAHALFELLGVTLLSQEQVSERLPALDEFTILYCKFDSHGGINGLIRAQASRPHFQRYPGKRLGITSRDPPISWRQHGNSVRRVRQLSRIADATGVAPLCPHHSQKSLKSGSVSQRRVQLTSCLGR